MISLTCTKCRATLTMDEAFAGGVCRCQHCGTIQTVPAQAKAAGTAGGTAAPTAGNSKALYQSRSAPAPRGSGLEELGEIIASSGLSSSRLRQPMRPASEPAEPASRKPRLNPALAGGIAGGVLAVILGLWFTLGGNGADPVAPPVGSNPTVAGGQTTQGPNFAGIPLSGNTIIYVLDRGASSQQAMGDIKEATYRSIASLGSQRKFRILFWETTSLEAFPPADTTYATPESLDAARKALDNVYAFGASDARSALESAAKNHPDEIVLVTAKGWALDEEFVTMVQSAMGNSRPTIHTLSIGEPSPALEAIARASGGQAIALTAGELRVAGK